MYILNLKIFNIFKYVNQFRIYSGARSISVQIEFGLGSLDIKILNSFRYLNNFGSDSILLFWIGFCLFLRIQGFFFASHTQKLVTSTCNVS